MRRRALNISVACCAALSLAIAGLWLRGMSARDELITHLGHRKFVAATFPHHLYIISTIAPRGLPSSRLILGLQQYQSRALYWQARYDALADGTVRVAVPFWILVAFTAVPPLWWLGRRLTFDRRRRDGLCRECGYDLRATRRRCPECGTPVEGADETSKPSLDAAQRYEATRRWQISLK